jgi:putative transposase
MLLVERHYTKGTPQIVELCQQSKKLYNKCNYYMRHWWFKCLKNEDWTTPMPNLGELIQLVYEEESFKNLHNTKTAKQTIRKVIIDWWNFKKALKAYKQNPNTFTRKPKPPYYKKNLAQVIFYNETIKKKPLKLGVITPTNGCFSIKSNRKFKQVIITPKTSGFVIEVQYEELLKKGKSKGKGICCIDIGLNTLAAITSDQHAPVLVNGRIIKSINQWFNKHPNKRNSRKRYWRLENYFHHASKWVVQNCVRHGISKIIIGKNDGWKQIMHLRKDVKQNFQYVPYYGLFEKIKYKATMEGIEVIFTEEAYTSKASYLNHDPLPKYGEEVPQFSGKRVKRGLYRSGHTTWNADVNGSLNIGRKVIGEALYGIVNRSVAATPRVINPLRFQV